VRLEKDIDLNISPIFEFFQFFNVFLRALGSNSNYSVMPNTIIEIILQKCTKLNTLENNIHGFDSLALIGPF
jgi:hypothetical protein